MESADVSLGRQASSRRARREADRAQAPRLPYLPGLDGMRALAVLAVLLYHADLAWFRGGFLGVEVFFVISGYLITSLLLAEWARSGRVDLKRFWLRRARRLLPALYLLLIAVLGLAVVFLPDEVAGLRRDALAAAGYATNWYLIFNHRSYFEIVGRPPLLEHLWSLAVEEQFYLIWPVVFTMGMLKLGRQHLVKYVLAGALASTLLMAILYRPDVDPSRIYYGTDTRAAGLLFGSALAFVWPPGQAHGPRRFLQGRGRWLSDGIALAALAALIVAFLRVDEYSALLYRGGFAAVSLTTVVAIAMTVDPGARLLPRVLGSQPLRWIGERSYGIYLWHWPIFAVTRPQLDVSLAGLPLLALRLALTLAVAELSYHFVESPIRNGALGRAWQTWREAHGRQRRRLGWRWAGGMASFLFFTILLGNSVVRAQPPAPPPYLAVAAIDTIDAPAAVSTGASGSEPVAGGGDAVASTASLTSTLRSAVGPRRVVSLVTPNAASSGSGEQKFDASALGLVGRAANCLAWTPQCDLEATDHVPRLPSSTPDGPSAARSAGSSALGAPELADQAQRPAARGEVSGSEPANGPTAASGADSTVGQVSASAAASAAGKTAVPGPPRVIAIGDSVMLGAVPELSADISGIGIDAELGRQVSAALDLLTARKAAGQLKDAIIIVHLGTNGTFSANQFDQVMALLSGAPRVIFVNDKVPRTWETDNNTVLADGVKRFKNAVLVDWHAASADHPEYFWDDGTHLRPEGAQAYAALIAAQVHAP